MINQVERIARALYPVAFQFPAGHKRRVQAMERAEVVVAVLARDRAETEKELAAARAALRWAVNEAEDWLYDGRGHTNLNIPPEYAEAIAVAQKEGVGT